MARTKIVASLGPSSSDFEVILRLCDAGASGFRINFAHGDESLWGSLVDNVLKVEGLIGRSLTLIGDLRGPSIRLGDIDKPLIIKRGETVKLVPRSEGSSERRELPLPTEGVLSRLEVGDVIVMDDGKVRFKVIDSSADYVELVALTDAEVKSRKALAVVNKEFDLPAITSKDLSDLNFALTHNFNYIGLSYVRRAEDVKLLRDIMRRAGYEGVKIIAKIETRSAVRNLDEIVEVADAILVARGDLGMNFGLEEIPYLQQVIVRKSIDGGKPVIVATQLLESMLENPVPTRAEVVDVTTAVSEGVDALMLTGETAVGRYPIEAVRWLKRIIDVAEGRVDVSRYRSVKTLSARFAKGVAELAEDLNAKLVVYSVHGNTARLISLLRPSVEFFVGTPNRDVMKALNILWGVKVYHVEAPNYEEGLELTYKLLRERGEIRLGDLVVLTYGLRDGEQAIRIRRVEK